MPSHTSPFARYLDSEAKTQEKLQKQRKAMKVVVRWDIPVKELQRRIQDKVVQHTARSSDQFRRITQNFSQAHNLTPEKFKTQIDHILDANIPEAQCMELFRRFDTDGSGDVDLQEFITGIMPKDYNDTSWNLCSEEREQKKASAYKEKMQKAGMQAFLPHNEVWGVEEIEFLLQDKITQRTSKSSDQFRQAFRLFATAGGITPALFEKQVNKMLGTTVNKEHALELFQRYDTDGSGDIDLQEFINGLMPKDYAKPPAVRKFPRMSDNSKTGQLKFGFSPKKPQNSSPSSRAPRGRVRQEFSQKLKNVKSQVEQDLFNAAPIAKQVPVAKEAQQLPVSNNNKKDGVREAAVATEPFIAPTVTALNLKVGLSHVSLQVTLTSMRYPVVLFVPLSE
jgi:Ca2+-binding EF-hand superfamily protein